MTSPVPADVLPLWVSVAVAVRLEVSVRTVATLPAVFRVVVPAPVLAIVSPLNAVDDEPLMLWAVVPLKVTFMTSFPAETVVNVPLLVKLPPTVSKCIRFPGPAQLTVPPAFTSTLLVTVRESSALSFNLRIPVEFIVRLKTVDVPLL